MGNVIEVEHISRCFSVPGGEFWALKDINAVIPESSFVILKGRSGSGKTTLMKTLLGLHRPLSGEVIFGEGVRKNQIGYLPQQTAVQKDFPASAEEIVLSGFQGQCGLRPFYTKEQKIRAREAMERMNISINP